MVASNQPQGFVKATLVQERTGTIFTFLFNPTEYTLSKTNSFKSASMTTRDIPIATFTGGGARSLTVELLLDTSEDPNNSAQTYAESLYALANIELASIRTDAKQGHPPVVQFNWGGVSFRSIITSINVRYSLFRLDGAPLRAHVNLTLQELADDTLNQGTNPSSYSEAGFRYHRVAPGETLSYIAFLEYGSATEWRRLADANGLEDPLLIEAGQLLKAPPLS